MDYKQLLKHLANGNVRFKCSNCNKKTWHRFEESGKVIRVLNRSGKRKFGFLGKHYGCILRPDEYYLIDYSVYVCEKCGKQKNYPDFPKKSQKRKQKESGIKIINNLAFWTFIYY